MMVRIVNARGFTVVELLVVCGVIAILAGLFVQNAQSSMHEARAVACEKNRTLYEEMETRFQHDRGRPSYGLAELVEKGYVNKVRCPQGGVLTWLVEDPELGGAHEDLVCSVHGAKARIRDYIPVERTPGGGPDDALSNSFDGPVASGWTETRGKYWQLVDGAYRAGTTTRKKSGEHRSFSGDESWTDYDLTVDATLVRGRGFGVFFRATNVAKTDGYLFEYDSKYKKGSFVIREYRKGRARKVLAYERAPKGYDAYGQPRQVKVEVRGNTFRAYLDGTEVVSATDDRHAAGAIGFRAHTTAVADFDNVRVELR